MPMISHSKIKLNAPPNTHPTSIPKIQILPPPLAAANPSPTKRPRKISHHYPRKKKDIPDGVDSEQPEGLSASISSQPRLLHHCDSESAMDGVPVVFEEISESISGNVSTQMAEMVYARYVDAVIEEVVVFTQVCDMLFVVQGWDPRTGTGNVRCTYNHFKTSQLIWNETQTHWFHLERKVVGDELVIVCYCPQGMNDCIHYCFMRNYGKEEFPDGSDDWASSK
jgi:hypothetical protein